ncbi:apolipoprotein N-acyltransferase [Synechococcus sp. M16CYN]
MGNHRLSPGWNAVLGGLFAGLAPSLGGPTLMLPALALLWSLAEYTHWCAIWGLLAVLVSHAWLLSLHPLTWMGVPAFLSLPLTVTLWLICGSCAAGLLALWSLLSQFCRCWFPQLKPCVRAFLLALVWAYAELILSNSPLFWIGVGTSTLPWDRPLAGLARWFGSYGLVVMQLIWGWWLWSLIECRVERLRRLLIGFGSILLAHSLGGVLLMAVPPAVGNLSLAAWQPAIPTREKLDAEQQSRLTSALVAALQAAENNQADALLAPEGVLPSGWQMPQEAPHVPLINGGFRWVKGQQRSTLQLFYPEADLPRPLLDKYRLVPIGEWIPPLLAGFTNGLSAVGGIHPSNSASRLILALDPPAAAAICYEIADGKALALATAQGASWLFSIANLDPYPLQLQHQFLAIAQLRAIESGRDLVSVANTGPTALISADGHVKQLLPPMQPGVATVEIKLRQGTGLYPWLVSRSR